MVVNRNLESRLSERLNSGSRPQARAFSAGAEDDDGFTNDETAGNIQNESDLKAYLASEGESAEYIDKLISSIKEQNLGKTFLRPQSFCSAISPSPIPEDL